MRIIHKMEDYLIEEIIKGLEIVEEEIIDSLHSDQDLLSKIASYLIKAGGKRVRPALVLLSFRAAGGDDVKKVIPIAAAIELIHTASLIHDDINDDSMFRRGILTANREFGNPNALIAGDFLFVKAFRIGGKYDWDIVKILADACAKLAEGEILQAQNRYNTEMTIDEYLRTINKKTASLITACARVGAILSGASQEEIEALTNYAINIGMAFQIRDDILDITGDKEITGKSIGTDIREGQLSILTIQALKDASEEERRELKRIIKKKENTEEEIERAISIVKNTDALDTAHSLAKDYARRAMYELNRLKESDYRDNLELIIEMICERYY